MVSSRHLCLLKSFVLHFVSAYTSWLDARVAGLRIETSHLNTSRIISTQRKFRAEGILLLTLIQRARTVMLCWYFTFNWNAVVNVGQSRRIRRIGIGNPSVNSDG